MKCEICNKHMWIFQSWVYVVRAQDTRILGKYHTKCLDKERAKEWKKTCRNSER